jgi:hypothetical protein
MFGGLSTVYVGGNGSIRGGGRGKTKGLRNRRRATWALQTKNEQIMKERREKALLLQQMAMNEEYGGDDNWR